MRNDYYHFLIVKYLSNDICQLFWVVVNTCQDIHAFGGGIVVCVTSGQPGRETKLQKPNIQILMSFYYKIYRMIAEIMFELTFLLKILA
jgi:hypothetical protein